MVDDDKEGWKSLWKVQENKEIENGVMRSWKENMEMETRVVKSEENNKEKPPHKDSSDPKMELQIVKEIKGRV